MRRQWRPFSRLWIAHWGWRASNGFRYRGLEWSIGAQSVQVFAVQAAMSSLRRRMNNTWLPYRCQRVPCRSALPIGFRSLAIAECAHEMSRLWTFPRFLGSWPSSTAVSGEKIDCVDDRLSCWSWRDFGTSRWAGSVHSACSCHPSPEVLNQ